MNLALFNPQGPIAAQEAGLIKLTVLIMLIVVIPALVTLFVFARRYRAGNAQARRASEMEQLKPHRAWRELVLWAIPISIIAVLAVFTWRSVHALDPYKSISAVSATGVAVQPLTIEVVALPWKWLFIYPEQDMATVNYLEIPAGTPVHFRLTADGPMSSFWIPQLGSQIYAMAAMETQLNLMASNTGDFVGKDTEINGAGYAGMTFKVHATTQDDFDQWIVAVKTGSLNSIWVNPVLGADEYKALAVPSENNAVAYYASVEDNLFDTIMMQPMMPSSTHMMPNGQVMPGMEMMPGMQM